MTFSWISVIGGVGSSAVTTESPVSWAPARPPRPRRRGRIVYWTIFGLLAVAMVSCLVGFVVTFRGYTEPSGSMQNTIRVGDHMWVQRGQDVRRGDIVVFDVPPGGRSGRSFYPGTYVKRVIGLPGDHVACCDASGDVTVNGKALDEQAYVYPNDEPSVTPFSVTLAPGQMWVMGDHRQISLDSRFAGAVPTADIVGRVVQIDDGLSTVNVTTPATFVADGLAPADRRQPLPLVLLGIAAILFVVLVLDGILGIVLWSLRRRRTRRQAMAYGPVL